MKHIIIIGHGIIGLVAARNLAESGYQVTHIGEGSAASYCAPGVNCIKGIFLGNDELFRKKIAGHRRLWQELVNLQKNTHLDLELKKGLIEPISDCLDYKTRSDRAFHGRFLGLYGATLHGQGEPFWVENLDKKYGGVIFHPDDFSYHPGRVLEALSESFLLKGGLVIKKKVASFRTSAGSILVTFADQTEISGDDLVVAAGAGSISLLESSNINLEGFKLKAGIALKASSELTHAFKIGSLSGVGNGRELRFGAVDLNLEQSCDELLVKKLQRSHEITFDNEHQFKPQMKKLAQTLRQITSSFSDPQFMAGVRIEGPRRNPLVVRVYSNNLEKGPIIATGFHKSGWSLAWEASDDVKTLIEHARAYAF